MWHQYFIYIVTNDRRAVLYTGVTNDLVRRVGEHRTKTFRGFTSRYTVDKLVYYEEVSDVNAAIAREKQIKAGSHRPKVALINGMNPDWRDLFDDLV
ncbi:MAG TPA: GIY-YIG nuclease family protein [Acetobacteraceae bacterium]|nr:GIY-YIG nuclease family protein [Acetobacteraceae bacterium]